MSKVLEMRRKLADIREQAAQINDAEEFGEEQQKKFDRLMSEARGTQAWLERHDQLNELPAIKPEPEESREESDAPKGAPAHHKRPTKDTAKALMCRYIRSGDPFAAREMHIAAQEEYRNYDHIADAQIRQAMQEERVSNNTIMNVTTAADGGNLVPTGHYNRIIARADETNLASRLPIMTVPGVGTTVNVPIDDEGDGEFITKAEQVDAQTNTFDRDAPAVGQVAMTLVKYTKKIELTDELLLDNDSNLMQWLEYRVGVGLAKTDNSLLVTAATTGGTAALTLDAAGAIGATEIPELVHLQAEGYEDGSVWLMKKGTQGSIMGLVGNNFQFVPTPVSGSRSQLWGFPILTTAKMAATGAGNKSLVFGNFAYMGVRRMPGLTLLRDPYTVDGMVLLKYYYRVVFKVLQAAAIIYATHPTA